MYCNQSFLGLLLSSLLIFSCTTLDNESGLSPEITSSDVAVHINYLASDELQGREAGTEFEAEAANYIADHFRDFGLEPRGQNQTYFHEFTINTAILNNPHASNDDSSAGEKRLARNVVGYLPGRSNTDEVIIIGAHYDHLGYGDFGSLYRGEEKKIHNGADDNASGTAGVLELAQYYAENRPQTNMLFIAFSGEEMGLLGSQAYVEEPTVKLENALAMINMDMVGRMANDKMMVFGIGTAMDWEKILTTANTDSLEIDLVKDGTGASDHTSFYYKNIPVLHYFTDTHADYHRPSDDAEYINVDGEVKLLNHLTRVIEYLDTIDQEQLAFQEAPGEQRRRVTMDGPTLGVLPDYGFDGEGFRITGVTEGRAASNAGIKGGDVIVGINGVDIKDIYGYMESLNTLKKGEVSKVTVMRDGERMTFDVQL